MGWRTGFGVMRRFETRVAAGTYELETDDGWIAIGPFEDLIEELGDVYEIEYDEEQAAMPWLETEDGVLRIDVRETLPTLSFDEEFLGHIRDTPDEHRADVFVNMIDEIWSSKGNLDL